MAFNRRNMFARPLPKASGGFGPRQSPFMKQGQDYASLGLQKTAQARAGATGFVKPRRNVFQNPNAVAAQYASQAQANANAKAARQTYQRPQQFARHAGYFNSPRGQAFGRRMFLNSRGGVR
jgi:hypothetical protein